MLRVALIFRKLPENFFSIEKVFKVVEDTLPTTIRYERHSMPLHSTGLKSIWRNISFSRGIKASIYHVTGDVHYVVAAMPPAKTILTIHDCNFLHNYSGLKRRIIKWIFLDMPVKRVKFITTISEATKKEIVTNTNCNPHKIRVIPDPIDPIFYYKQKPFDSLKPRILFVGTTANKNLERTIEAIAGIDCVLVVVGKLNTAQLQQLESGSSEFENHQGLSDSEMAELYSGCDIVLFPSTFEGFGLPIIEGQKSGRVVITSQISPMQEVAGDGALFVDPFDPTSIRQAVQDVISDEKLRMTLIENGFQAVGRFDPQKIAKQYTELYELVASNSLQ